MKMPVVLFAVAIATLSPAPRVRAQEKTDFKIPRTADGKPDFGGVWTSGGAERLGDLGGAPPRFTSAPNLPRPEPLPYQPWAEAERQKFLARRGIDDPIGRCMMPGVPRTTGMPMPILPPAVRACLTRSGDGSEGGGRARAPARTVRVANMGGTPR